MSVCVCMYNYYVDKKNRLFSALLLANILLSVICCLLFEFKHLQCGLLCPASCTDRAIHAFPNRPLNPEYFLLSFNGTPHPLGYYSWSLELAAVVLVVCFSECFSSCDRTATIRCYDLYLYAAAFQAQPPTMC